MKERKEYKFEAGFSEAKLPMKYLGVPLISGKLLSVGDCEPILDKLKSRITG
ncbi:hypothetical protein SLEP1_g3200 [Rubroshorea leprosula]|uniref:Uncharacterized protein n=1 Tax=Rubroshorea leprosula TaxID=152421 RepID=A0AAV5HQN6_9ROSI|nr:hypothetical protein SLEP1_g3200 [Rubroshorea leprosula]